MLTHEEILKVVRWRDIVGERRPGFLHDDTNNLQGPICACHAAAAPSHKRGKEVKKPNDVAVLSIRFEEDAETGESRLVYK